MFFSFYSQRGQGWSNEVKLHHKTPKLSLPIISRQELQYHGVTSENLIATNNDDQQYPSFQSVLNEA